MILADLIARVEETQKVADGWALVLEERMTNWGWDLKAVERARSKLQEKQALAAAAREALAAARS